jgi:hypothetical protein
MDFIALKAPQHLDRFEPTKLGFSGRHDNHYTTENDHMAESQYAAPHCTAGLYVLQV